METYPNLTMLFDLSKGVKTFNTVMRKLIEDGRL